MPIVSPMKHLLALLLPIALAGCKPAGKNDFPPRPAGSGRLFAVSCITLNNPFFLDLNEGIKNVVESHGDRLVTLDSQHNSSKQKNDISDILQQQPAAIFLNPENWEGIRGSLMEAKRKNV